MVTYECPRCGYKNNIKTHMKKHFLRKKPCTATVKDIPIEQCIKHVFSSGNKMYPPMYPPMYFLK